MKSFPELTVHDPAGDVFYVPFVTEDGRVGYRVGRTDDRNAETFIYFNPSSTEGDSTPNVFVYIGVDNNPEHDEPHHFYTLDREVFGFPGVEGAGELTPPLCTCGAFGVTEVLFKDGERRYVCDDHMRLAMWPLRWTENDGTVRAVKKVKSLSIERLHVIDLEDDEEDS